MKSDSIKLFLSVGFMAFLLMPGAWTQVETQTRGDSDLGAALEKAGDLLNNLLQGGQFLIDESFAFDDKKKNVKLKIAKPEINVKKASKGKATLGVYIDEADGKVRIMDVIEGGPAEKAGLMADDIIMALGKEKIPTIDRLMDVMSKVKPGKNVVVRVKRGKENVACKVKTGGTDVLSGAETQNFGLEEFNFKGTKLPDLHGSEQGLDFLSKLKDLDQLKNMHGDKPHFLFKSDDGSTIVLGQPDKEVAPKKNAPKKNTNQKKRYRVELDLEDMKGEGPGVRTRTKRIEIPGGEAIVELKIVTEGECEECERECDESECESCERECDIECNEECYEECEVYVYKGDGPHAFFDKYRNVPAHGKAHPPVDAEFHCECCPHHGMNGRKVHDDGQVKIYIIKGDTGAKAPGPHPQVYYWHADKKGLGSKLQKPPKPPKAPKAPKTKKQKRNKNKRQQNTWTRRLP